MKTNYTIIILLFVLFLGACSNDKDAASEFSFSDQLSETKRAEFELKVSQKIGEYTNSSLDSTHVSLGIDYVFVSEELTKLYDEVDNKRLWSEEKNRQDLINIIEGAYFEGLDPNDYHFKSIKQLYLEKTDDLDEEAERLAKIDVLMSDAIMLYAFHMIQGKVDPESLDPNWNYSRQDVPEDIEWKLISRLQEKTLADSIENISPRLPMYKRYKKWFVHYDSLQKNDIKLAQLEYPGEPLKLGDSSALVVELKNHLENFDIQEAFELNLYEDPHFLLLPPHHCTEAKAF